MFLGKENRKYKTGSKLVSFCKDCNSHNIKIIRVCKDCGSHNIQSPFTSTSLFDDFDPRGIEDTFDTKEVFVYKCDVCGKEFDFSEENLSNSIYLLNNKFIIDNPGEWDNNFDLKRIDFDQDLCWDCKEKLVNALNNEIYKVTSKENVYRIAEEILREVD